MAGTFKEHERGTIVTRNFTVINCLIYESSGYEKNTIGNSRLDEFQDCSGLNNVSKQIDPGGWSENPHYTFSEPLAVLLSC